MKRISIILFVLIGIVQAQTYYEVTMKNCVVEFKDTLTLNVPYSFNANGLSYREYSSRNVEVRDNYNKNGFDINHIVNFANRSLLLDSLNAWSGRCGIGNISMALSNICVTCDSLPIDTMYLNGGTFYITQGTDTNSIDLAPYLQDYAIDTTYLDGDRFLIVQNLDTFYTDFSQFNGIWTTASGKIENVSSLPLIHSFQGYSINNDSLDVGFGKLPYAGLKVPNLGSYFGLHGFLDGRGVGDSETFIVGYADFLGDKRNNIEIIDTSLVSIISNETLNIYSNGDVEINAKEDVKISVLDLNLVRVDSFGVKIIDNNDDGTTGQILTNVGGYAKWGNVPIQTLEEFTGTTSATQLTMEIRNSNYSYQVYINGVLLPSSGVVSFSGKTLMLSEAPLVTDIIQVVYYY